jgi:transposase
MGAAVSITRLELTASELRKAASGEKDSSAARRILALARVLDGVDRKTAAENCGMDRQTLRDWVHRYNAAGLAGLRNLKSPGPGSKLTAQQQAELAELVEAGPDPAVHGVGRWRRVDLRDELKRRFGVALHERSVGKVLAKLGYRKLSVILRAFRLRHSGRPMEQPAPGAPSVANSSPTTNDHFTPRSGGEFEWTLRRY